MFGVDPRRHRPSLRGRLANRWPLAASAVVHALAAALIIGVAKRMPAHAATMPSPALSTPIDVRHIVFIAPDTLRVGGGGGGGGNGQTAPIRRAQGIGTDRATLRVATRKLPTAMPIDRPSPPALVLDAKPLASGSVDQIGLPSGGESIGTSTGPGSGGGVGTGVGTGIGAGRGPGLGPGSGGGTGGGIYRPGGAVTAPRALKEVMPTYTADAMDRKIQGTVVLELVVTPDGRPEHIRVVRSLDADGLDAQAVIAASQWRFEPGRLAGKPVDVLVTLMLDFHLR